MTQKHTARRGSFTGWEQLLGLDGSAPLADIQAEGHAVVYLRVSTPRQMLTAIDIDADGNSIATQREACLVRAKRAKAPIAAEFVEPGNSAQSIGKRPVFREMLRYIEEHPEVSYVVIYMRSRAFRNLADAAITKRILAGMGVKLISAKEDFGEGYMADAMEAVTDIMNEVQVRQSGEDIKQKMLHKAMSGGTTGRAKIGYLNVRKDYEGRLVNTIDIDPQRAPLIRWAFEEYATGEVSMSLLRDRLAEQGLTTRPTARWKEGPLSLNQLSLVLRDPYYLGMVTYKGQVFDGRHEALVSAETFERVQEVLAVRKRPTQRDQVHAHFLRGLMCCDRCHEAGRERRMIYTETNNGKGGIYGYFLCRGRQDATCDLPHLPVKELERAVAREVRGLTLDPGFAAEMKRHVHEALNVQQQGEREARARLAGQLKKLEVQESNLLDIAADGELSADAVKARLRSLAVQRRTIVDKLARSDEQIQRHADVVLAYLDLLERPYSFYVSASDPIKRRILEAFFSVLWIEDESHQVRAQGQVHEPIALIQAAAAEWAATNAKSASDTADALDSTPSNYYLWAICSSKTSLVGLVQRYSNDSTGVAKLRQLANLKPSRVAVTSRPVPRRARRLTDAEKMAFVEGYKQGELVADLARQLGVHRTTLDMLVARLNLSRVDPNEVPAKLRDFLIEKYRAGESLAAIGEEYGFSANKVQRLLVSTDEPIRSRGPKKSAVTSEQIQQMVSQYEQGEAIAAIAASTGVSYAQTRSCLIEAGVRMRPRGGLR